MKKILLLLLFVSYLWADEPNACLGMYQAEHLLPIEKEFVVGLKPSNPDNPRTGGYAKFRATIVYNDKKAGKELEAKVDIIRFLVNDITSGFFAHDVQGAAGRCKLAMTVTASINAILTDGSIVGVVFPDFVIQP